MTADPDAPRPWNSRDRIEAGRRRVAGPAAMLITTGVILLSIAFLIAVQSGLLTATFARQQEVQEQTIDANPKLTPAQKAQMKATLRQTFQGMGIAFQVLGVTNLVAAGVIGLGAYRMLTVSGRGWAIAGAVVALIPCLVGYAWVVGLPAGIWALVVLNRADVKAAFRAARRERELELGGEASC